MAGLSSCSAVGLGGWLVLQEDLSIRIPYLGRDGSCTEGSFRKP